MQQEEKRQDGFTIEQTLNESTETPSYHAYNYLP